MMERTLVFLDCDGVLNSDASAGFRPKKRYRGGGTFSADGLVWSTPRLGGGGGRVLLVLESDRVAVARQLVVDTDAQVVLSSSWRDVVTLAHMSAMLDRAGWTDAPLVDVTPSAPQLGYDVARPAEVRAWVDQHLSQGDRWVALDDSWTDDTDDAHVVHVDPRVGLTVADAASARRMLQGG